MATSPTPEAMVAKPSIPTLLAGPTLLSSSHRLLYGRILSLGRCERKDVTFPTGHQPHEFEVLFGHAK